MKNFNRGGGSKDRHSGASFKRRDSQSADFNRGASSSGPAIRHKAICTECGAPCEVPFKPTGDRPVLCGQCFKGKDRSTQNRPGGRDFFRPSFGDKRLFKATCADCGQPCEVPFQPSSGKPVYCSHCFGKSDKSQNYHSSAPRESSTGLSSSNQNGSASHLDHSFDAQLKELNAKLDQILLFLKKPSSLESKSKLEAPRTAQVSKPKSASKNIKKKAEVAKTSPAKKTKKK